MLQKQIRFLPNLLTILRILLCPLVLNLLFSNKFYLALAVYLIAVLTDYLDGYIARKFNATSDLGSILDPIADKVIVISFCTALMNLKLCPPWFLGLLLAVILLQGIGMIALRLIEGAHSTPFRALWIGKWNTFIQLLWIGLLLLLLSVKGLGFLNSPYVLHSIYAVFGILQVGVFIGYFFHYRFHLTPEARTVFPLHQ